MGLYQEICPSLSPDEGSAVGGVARALPSGPQRNTAVTNVQELPFSRQTTMKENNCEHLLAGPAPSLSDSAHTASAPQPGRHWFLLASKTEKGASCFLGVPHSFIYRLTFLALAISKGLAKCICKGKNISITFFLPNFALLIRWGIFQCT